MIDFYLQGVPARLGNLMHFTLMGKNKRKTEDESKKKVAIFTETSRSFTYYLLVSILSNRSQMYLSDVRCVV